MRDIVLLYIMVMLFATPISAGYLFFCTCWPPCTHTLRLAFFFCPVFTVTPFRMAQYTPVLGLSGAQLCADHGPFDCFPTL